MKKVIVIVAVLALIGGGIYWYMNKDKKTKDEPAK